MIALSIYFGSNFCVASSCFINEHYLHNQTQQNSQIRVPIYVIGVLYCNIFNEIFTRTS